jgi:hypothetical protein
MELVDHIETAFETAFETGPVTRGDLLAAATASHARPEVIEVLARLPDLRYRNVRDLWQELADVPVGR